MHQPGPAAVNQRGAAAVTIMLCMLGLVAILGLVEVSYLYWAKRDVQKIADLAALAGAQRLELCRADHADNQAARQNAATDNAFPGGLEIRCGHWSAQTGSDAVVDVASGRALNAVQVDASRSVIPLFGQISGVPSLSARAIARRSEPVAAFAIGSRLVDINSSAPVQGLLRLVGIDLSGTEVASFRGLAQVKITPRGLLQALGIPVAADLSVGDLNNLLATHQVQVGALLDAVVDAGTQQGVANINISALRSRLASLGISNLSIPLGSANSTSGLFANIAAGAAASSALDADINALGLLMTSLQIANSQHAVSIPDLSLLGLQAKASVIEPPSIAIGPVGTTAYNSQVRLFLDIDTDRIPALNLLLGLLGTRVKLPVYVDVVDGFGRLSAVDCAASPRTATVDVTSSVANICVGKALTPWDSTTELCASGLGNEELVRLLGKTALNHKIHLPALSSNEQVTLAAGQSASVGPNPLAIGDLLSNLVNTLLGTLGSLFQQQGDATSNARELADRYLQATKKSSGAYDPEAVIAALRDGNAAQNLPALGSWTTDIPVCTSYVLFSNCVKQPGNVWDGFRHSVTINDASLLGGLFDVLGLSSCQGVLAGLLAYNTCVRNNLATYLQTKPGGLQGGSYDPATGSGSCNTVLCILLKPVLEVLRPLLNGIGQLLSSLLSDVLGINLGRSVVEMHSIQCGGADLVR